MSNTIQTPEQIFKDAAKAFERAAYDLLRAWEGVPTNPEGACVFNPDTISTWLPMSFDEWCYALSANMVDCDA